jgi:TatA/E family protein of Tat protein translocase
MNLGMPEMIFIFLLALVVFGPRKLPELGRQLGKALAEFKRASNEFKNQLEVEMMNIELEEHSKKEERPALNSDNGRTILPVERLFDTTSGAPSGSVSRGLPETLNSAAAPLSGSLSEPPLTPVDGVSSPSESAPNSNSASPNA